MWLQELCVYICFYFSCKNIQKMSGRFRQQICVQHNKKQHFFSDWVYLSASLLPMRDGYSVSTSLATFSNSTPFNFSHSNKCSSISVILNCISSKTSEIIAFSCTYLPCAYPPLVKHLFQSILYPFTIYLLYLLFTSKSFLYIQDKNICFVNIFCQ